MEHKLIFDLNRLPGGEWLFLAEAMQFTLWGQVTPDDCDVYEAIPLQGAFLEGLAADDADKFNARIFQLQGDMQRAARDGTLVMKGIPMMFWIGSVAEDPAARQPIPAEFFMVDGARGFDYEDGAIAPFSFEGHDPEEYNRFLRRCTVPAAGSADHWAHVIVRRDSFITFLRDHLGATMTEGLEAAPDTTLPKISEVELLAIVEKTNWWLGGTEEHPINERALHVEINGACVGRRSPVRREDIRKAHAKTFADRRGKGRLSKEEEQARKLRQENCAKKMSLAELLFSTG